MAEQQGYEYDQYAQPQSGRLFSNAMFGYNKEEVHEYIDELQDESYQRQETADAHILDLTERLAALEASLAQYQSNSADPAELARLQSEHAAYAAQAAQLNEELEIARAATQQSEEELAESREQLHTAQQENTWLREEFSKTDEQVADLRRQLDAATEGQWSEVGEKERELKDANTRLDELNDQLDAALQQLEDHRRQVEDGQTELAATRAELDEKDRRLRDYTRQLSERDRQLSEKDHKLAEQQRQLEARPAGPSEEDRQQLADLGAKLEAALAEAESLRVQLANAKTGESASAAIIADANAEADRIRAVAVDEKERIRRQIRSSAGGLAESITNLRGDVSGVEANVTRVLETAQTALADILTALGRTEQNLTTLGVQVERFPAQSAPVPRQPQQPPVVYFQPTPQQPELTIRPDRRRPQPAGYGAGGFRRVAEEEPAGNVRPFKPAYSTSPTSTAAYWPQTQKPAPPPEENDKMRALAENLADTLVETLSEMLT